MRRMRLNLRTKLLLFAIAIAIVPLLVAGRTMIRIAQDELKSSANEQLVNTANQIVREINDLYERTWLAPLVLIRNAIDDPALGVEEKIALLTLGIANIPDIVALQITVEGASLPLVVTKDEFTARLKAADLDPVEVLRVPAALVGFFEENASAEVKDVVYLPQTDDWLATVVLPLKSPLAGSRAVFSARIDLNRVETFIRDNPFSKTGVITVVDGRGHKVFDPARTDLNDFPIVAAAMGLMASRSSVVSVEPYARPDGTVMLGAYAFPRWLKWAILVEKNQRDAYLAIDEMTRSLALWGMIGLGVAGAGAVALALGMSRPILEIDRVTVEVAKGNFAIRVVRGVRLKDEIGDLARRMNEMIVGLNERFQLEKFVSGGTMAAIRTSEREGVQLGGARRRATMLFSDIRGYTAFAEGQEPDVVVDVLNFYFQHLTDLVKQHHGDVDKFVGDQIVAVFQGDEMESDAVACALAMQQKMAELSRDRPEFDLAVGIGINTGEVTMGAMGSAQRMDYTVLGDAVNLAARLCAHAGRGQTLISQSTCAAIADLSELVVEALEPIQVKGKKNPVVVYEVRPLPTVEAVAS
jgi:adenylate cyclase